MISSNYPANSEIASLTARMLLEVKAVHFNSKNPFTLASGLPSPTYIDCRKLISYPRVRSTIMDFLAITVMRNVGFEVFDNIAGGETAGIPFAALVAERMGLPMSYIRKKPKGYGRNARIEGNINENQNTDSELNLLSVVAIPILKRFGIPIAALAIGIFMVIRYAIL